MWDNGLTPGTGKLSRPGFDLNNRKVVSPNDADDYRSKNLQQLRKAAAEKKESLMRRAAEAEKAALAREKSLPKKKRGQSKGIDEIVEK